MAINNSKEMYDFELFVLKSVDIDLMKYHNYDINKETPKIIKEIKKRFILTNYNIYDYYYICNKYGLLAFMFDYCFNIDVDIEDTEGFINYVWSKFGKNMIMTDVLIDKYIFYGLIRE
jgi:hypothetical protein